MSQHAYLVTNALAALAASAYTWSNADTLNRAYLSDGRMDKQFVATAASSALNVVIDMGSATALAAIAILNNNLRLATSPTVTIKGADNAGMSTNVVTVKSASTPVTTAPKHKDHVFQFASTSKRYWQILFTWTGSFELKIGELFAGAPTALTRFDVYGRGETEEIVGTRFHAYNGEQRGHFIAGPFRMKHLQLEELSESELAEYLAMWRGCFAGALSMLWIERYEAVSTAAAAAYQDCIFGKVQQADLSWNESDYGIHDPGPLTIRQLAREVGA